MTTYKVRLTGQNRRIFDLMVRRLRDGITAKDAREECGVERLASRIHDLRSMGIDIRVEDEDVRNRYNETARIARYWLIPKGNVVMVEPPVAPRPQTVEEKPAQPQVEQQDLPW